MNGPPELGSYAKPCHIRSAMTDRDLGQEPFTRAARLSLRLRVTRTGTALVALAALTCGACAATPDLVFDDGEGSLQRDASIEGFPAADAASTPDATAPSDAAGPRDASTVLSDDAAAHDAAVKDSAVRDAGPPGLPDASPADAGCIATSEVACCGQIPCVGACGGHCADCPVTCSPGQYCCIVVNGGGKLKRNDCVGAPAECK